MSHWTWINSGQILYVRQMQQDVNHMLWKTCMCEKWRQRTWKAQLLVTTNLLNHSRKKKNCPLNVSVLQQHFFYFIHHFVEISRRFYHHQKVYLCFLWCVCGCLSIFSHILECYCIRFFLCMFMAVCNQNLKKNLVYRLFSFFIFILYFILQ